ncbi:uncharacterized protein BYT42DRAFT_588491 [Radiomyces spectabilis]|uniref:uncharacterized protein n=1 Tax=Radiomyces spectabilis TaxID=64574 RepID=UPI002220BB2D|nr:uncharacterized protein BYT42DRAFT_588491 [Radiomyces spectabilis]KAI8365990.1 hypothetical protein BYT42DRAFT_588491 [Radiomyces spectabilis]
MAIRLCVGQLAVFRKGASILFFFFLYMLCNHPSAAVLGEKGIKSYFCFYCKWGDRNRWTKRVISLHLGTTVKWTRVMDVQRMILFVLFRCEPSKAIHR